LLHLQQIGGKISPLGDFRIIVIGNKAIASFAKASARLLGSEESSRSWQLTGGTSY
jgi:hypothetical protein